MSMVIELTKEQMIELTPIWDELEITAGGAVFAQVSFYEGLFCKVIPSSTVAAVQNATGFVDGDGWQSDEYELRNNKQNNDGWVVLALLAASGIVALLAMVGLFYLAMGVLT